MFFRRKKQVQEVKRRVGVLSRSWYDVARFPMQAGKLVIFGLGEKGVQVSSEILDIPRDLGARVEFIKGNCDVLLTCDANRISLVCSWILALRYTPRTTGDPRLPSTASSPASLTVSSAGPVHHAERGLEPGQKVAL